MELMCCYDWTITSQQLCTGEYFSIDSMLLLTHFSYSINSKNRNLLVSSKKNLIHSTLFEDMLDNETLIACLCVMLVNYIKHERSKWNSLPE